MMRIIDLEAGQKDYIQQTAAILVKGFVDMAPAAWPDMESALEEVEESLDEDRISRIAIGDAGRVLGWIGGIQQSKTLWELHPMVVDPAQQGQGIGRALIADFEAQVKIRGAVAIWLGSDDEMNLTSLGGIDLYPNVLENLAAIKNLRNHPFGFYQKMGYTIVGAIPDASGFGKPDILMAKRVGNIE